MKFALVLRPDTGNKDEEGNNNDEVARVVIECAGEPPLKGDKLLLYEPITIVASNGKTVVVDGGLNDGRLACEVTGRWRAVSNNTLDTGGEGTWPSGCEVEADTSLYTALQLLAAINPEVIWSEIEDPEPGFIPYEVFDRKAKLGGETVTVVGPNLITKYDRDTKVRFANRSEQKVKWEDLELTPGNNHYELHLNGF